MARVFTAGNELGDYTADEFQAYGVAESPSFNAFGGAPTPQGQSGRYVFNMPSGWGLRKDFTTGSMTVPNGIRECYIRFYINHYNRCDGTWEMCRWLDASQNVIFSLRVVDDGSGGSYGGIWYPSFTQNTNGTQFIGNTAYAFRNDIWHRVEIYLKMASSGGVVTIWVNDILVGTSTGAIVGPAVQTFFTNFVICNFNVSGGGTNGRGFDNIAINAITDGTGANIAGTFNTGRCGSGYVINALPSRSGLFSQFTNDYGNSTNNFLHVNQLITQNPTTFVGSNTANTKDTYGLPRVPEEFRGVNVIKSVAYAVRNGTSITKAKMLLEPAYPAPLTAPTVTMAAGGSVDAGTHTWAITNVHFINPNNDESLLGPASSIQTVVGGTQTANLTNIPLGPTGTAARQVYRTKAGGSTYFLVGQINDNTTTIFTDTLADSALGTEVPPAEIALPAGNGVGITLPIGGYGYISQHFDGNTNTGAPFTREEVNSIEAGLQFIA